MVIEVDVELLFFLGEEVVFDIEGGIFGLSDMEGFGGVLRWRMEIGVVFCERCGLDFVMIIWMVVVVDVFILRGG